MTPEQAAEIAKVWSSARRVSLHIGLIAVACVAVAFAAGRLGLDRPLEIGKCMAFAGGVLAAWGTYFLLHAPPATWGEDTPWEELHKKLFRLSFLPGFVLAALGAIW